VDYKYISADNHLDAYWLPKDLWQKRLPANMREKGPKVVETPQGSYWFWEGKTHWDSADGSSNAKMQKKYFSRANLKGGERPPADPKMLLEHMDMASIYSGIFFANTRKWSVQDPKLRDEIFRTYNDFIIEEINAHSPDRILALPNLPTYDPAGCVTELKRLIDKGTKAVEFGLFDLGKPLYDEAWEPVFEMAASANIPLCTHIGDGAGNPYPPNVRGSSLAHFSITPFAALKFIPQFVFSGAFERFPDLRVCIAECRIGWLPFLFNWMDRQAEIRPPDPTVPLSKMPTDYIKNNMVFTFEEDYIGARMLDKDWAHLAGCAVWGSDYPHEQGTWPDPSAAIEEMFKGIDPKLKHEILYEHSRRFFNIEGPQTAKKALSA
jgi:predicted TIM-barrel fold metal-dependent hydrolase